MMLPPVVVGVVWRLMLNSNFGAVNGTLKSVGVDADALTWTKCKRAYIGGVDVRISFTKGYETPTAPIPKAFGGA